MQCKPLHSRRITQLITKLSQSVEICWNHNRLLRFAAGVSSTCFQTFRFQVQRSPGWPLQWWWLGCSGWRSVESLCKREAWNEGQRSELKHVETCWNRWVVGQSALLVSFSFVFRLSRHSDYNSKRVSMPTWIWRLYLSYFSRTNSNSNVQCCIVKQLRCECLISYHLVSSLFKRPSHGATMRSIGPKSWWKARLS